jgi:hypothetical protein
MKRKRTTGAFIFMFIGVFDFSELPVQIKIGFMAVMSGL